ncbi:hypothetical protein [Pseudomonas phage PAJU2]|uniref:hypothetical protein n=1 Tax=Pseudomonas phage PAJU2 TaxID=504346 RepID=UPI000181F4E0|nr:hypothetical protein PAJU2_gp04 [Pseudomonas phage PAJU2]BAG74988.1 hypothetical protein [Pseudomonas phage PAJU2]
MKVDVLYLKSGKPVSMEKRYADILSKLGHVLVVEPIQAGAQAEIVTAASNVAEKEQPLLTPEAETEAPVGLVYPGVLSVPKEGTYILEKSERVIAADAPKESQKKRGRKPKAQE